jgi:hypothetical protein
LGDQVAQGYSRGDIISLGLRFSHCFYRIDGGGSGVHCAIICFGAAITPNKTHLLTDYV